MKNFKRIVIIGLSMILLTNNASFANNGNLLNLAGNIDTYSTQEVVLKEGTSITREDARAMLTRNNELLDGFIAETLSTKVVLKTSNGHKTLTLKATNPSLTLKGKEEYSNFLSFIKRGTEKLTTREAVIYVNNEINKRVSYATVIPEDSKSSNIGETPIYTAYGALINGQAVCQGYSNLFMLIMDDLNIPSIKVRGYSKHSGEYHVWNSVLIDGEWLYVDTTWNDALNNKHLLTNEKFETNYRTWDRTMEQEVRELKALTMKPN